ncbi:MAG: branched-chain amino acid aminotransferase [Acidobacteriota bacterium]|nr:branched-chain amino acid aminotransferase [Acidobacteriota bacterium]
MHQHVILNRRLLEARRARLHAVTASALYGRGVFTTVAIHAGRPFLWDAHWSRLLAHAERVGVECDFGDNETALLLARLIEANAVLEGRARVHLFGRAVRGRWKVEGEGGASDLLMLTADAWAAPETLALTVSPYRVNTCSPLAGIKTVNRLEQVLAWEEARARDFDEAVCVNERGEVVSATTANLFWVKHGTVYTPALAAAPVAGTTRACVLELAGELAFPVVEGSHTLHDIAEAEEIFLTSASLGVALVSTFDYHRYTVPVGSPALRLREAFRQLTLSAGQNAEQSAEQSAEQPEP